MPRKKKRQAANLPKIIAGVKIGKDLRSAIEPVLRFAGHPMVSDVLAAALVAGAEHLAVGPKGRKSSTGYGKAPGTSESKGGKAGKDSPAGLLLAIAAGEIASRIVTAYQAAPAKSRRPSGEGRQSGADGGSGGKSRSGKAKALGEAPRLKARDRPTGGSRGRK